MFRAVCLRVNSCGFKWGVPIRVLYDMGVTPDPDIGVTPEGVVGVTPPPDMSVTPNRNVHKICPQVEG